MKKIVFTEAFCSPENLFPFTLTRQIQDIRVGVLTIREKWELALGSPSFDKQEGDYKDLERAMVLEKEIGDDVVYLVHGNILPTPKLVKAIKALQPGEFISVPNRENLVFCISAQQILDENKIAVNKAVELKEEIKELKYPWDILSLNAWAIEKDVALLQKKQKFATVSGTNKTVNEEKIFIEKGAEVEHCFINASAGPVYIAKGAIVMEGSMLRGPLAIGKNAVVKMGAKLYGATTIGPHCTAGGEIKNSVLFEYSNKAHDGYLGDSVLGAWCNLGAGTSNSNVKNSAGSVQVYTPNGIINVGLKCGMLMGDYSRTAINTAVNTGTVIGVCCNVFGNGLTPKFIPHFSWGADGIQRYELDKALAHIDNWKALKKEHRTDAETFILTHIFDHY
jgi:UDP-N-acetylglucosamine diphosphorylase / glucose-1-phosphate thymidylyltransferase / UDP-N-acetylgalactosamine diphosphorylase / glucosamine-1-phosphate N-acetyltransferase / galactosamine-1-phosphate N-acetyltransferase